MNCTVKSVNCFLRVPLVYQLSVLPYAMLPRQARGTHKKNSLPNLLHSSFWDVVFHKDDDQMKSTNSDATAFERMSESVDTR